MKRCNSCDGIYRSCDVHFTNFCDNKCAFCIDKNSIAPNCGKPNWLEMYATMNMKKQNFDDILILGGEPMLFIDELYQFVHHIKAFTKLKVYCTTSMPITCTTNPKFYKILEMLDGLNLSAQHHDEEIADIIRGTKSQYDRQAFYKSLPHKEKIRIQLNLMKNWMECADSVRNAINYYTELGFTTIKLSELQNAPEEYVSFEKIFDIKLKSPYTHGCQTDVSNLFIFSANNNAKIILKRSCFLVEPTLKASFRDGLKVIFKRKSKNTFGVLYEDGIIRNKWVKETPKCGHDSSNE